MASSAETPEDISVEVWDFSEWSSKTAGEQAVELCRVTLTEITSAVLWYQDAKRRKRQWSRFLRGAAIIVALVGGIAPLAAGFFRGDHNVLEALHIIEAGYMLLAMAAGLWAFDRFFGLSSGWIRYMTMLLALERLKSEFTSDWAHLLLQSTELGEQSLNIALLERAKASRLELLALIESETATWGAEFRASLSDFDAVISRASHAG